MSEPLIATKLNIPHPRPHFVSRMRLIRLLEKDLWNEDGFSRKLTLISAPAGYGKTMLMADWGTMLSVPCDSITVDQVPKLCWLSLDEGENDPIRFLTYVIAALNRIDGKLGENTRAMLQSQQTPPQEVFLGSLINDIAGLSLPIILTLDDYHLIHTTAIHQMLNFLIEHQPMQLHMILLTREDPPLPLPKLRVRGQITEIRQSDLRFTLEEMKEYLSGVEKLDLSEEDLKALERRTEGWVAGLQLAALSMHGRKDLSGFIKAFTGSNRYILDYLIEEVFKQQSPDVQSFLLKSSVLDQLFAPLCDFVTECSNSRELLQSLEQANLFIVALDQDRDWYRFHRLFVELLRHRLRLSEEFSSSSLHRRASRWYKENGFQAEAIHHALAAEDWETAAILVQESNDAMLKRGEVVTLLGWFQKLPEGIVLASMDLCVSYAWVLLLVGQFSQAEQLLDHAEKMAKDEPRFLGDVFSAQAYLARSTGDPAKTIEKSQQALALLPKDDLAARSIVALNLGLTYWHGGMLTEAETSLKEAYRTGHPSGNTYVAITAKVFLGRMHASRGELQKAAEQYQEVIGEGGPVPMLALAHLDLSTLHYEWNQMAEAEEHHRLGKELSVRSGNIEFQIAAEMMQARLKLTQGAVESALQAAQRAQQMSKDFSLFTQARCASCLALIALARGDLETAQQQAEQMSVDGDVHSFYMFLNLTRARLLLAQGRKAEAAADLESCYQKAWRGGWGYACIAARVLQCLAAENAGSAFEFLLDALNLAESQGFIRIFADEGEALIPYLQEQAQRGKMVDYVGEILSVMGRSIKYGAQTSLTETLSAREIEVLRLLVAGLSNREIAEKLILSLGTVKTHIHNIYGKLDARNRMAAIKRARELELL